MDIHITFSGRPPRAEVYEQIRCSILEGRLRAGEAMRAPRRRTSGPIQFISEEQPVKYRGLVKSLVLPSGYEAPCELAYQDIRARAISRADLENDVKGINSSIELIQRTRGGGWPTEPVSEDFNFVDLVWHELEFREGYSFTYAVYDADDHYLGCCYLYPMGRRTPLAEDLLKYDVDVSWWVTPEAYERGCYMKLFNALQHWMSEAFPFTMAHYSNVEIPGQDDAF